MVGGWLVLVCWWAAGSILLSDAVVWSRASSNNGRSIHVLFVCIFSRTTEGKDKRHGKVTFVCHWFEYLREKSIETFTRTCVQSSLLSVTLRSSEQKSMWDRIYFIVSDSNKPMHAKIFVVNHYFDTCLSQHDFVRRPCRKCCTWCVVVSIFKRAQSYHATFYDVSSGHRHHFIFHHLWANIVLQLMKIIWWRLSPVFVHFIIILPSGLLHMLNDENVKVLIIIETGDSLLFFVRQLDRHFGSRISLVIRSKVRYAYRIIIQCLHLLRKVVKRPISIYLGNNPCQCWTTFSSLFLGNWFLTPTLLLGWLWIPSLVDRIHYPFFRDYDPSIICYTRRSTLVGQWKLGDRQMEV